MRDAGGLVIGAVAIFSDVTDERVQLQELAASAALNARLARQLHERQQRLEEHLRVILPADLHESRAVEALSRRERQVLSSLARGGTNRQIGDTLGISSGTVRKHVEHILVKLKVTDRTAAAVRASELGWIESPPSG